MNKRLLAVLLFVLTSLTASSQSLTWHDPEKAGFPVVQGQSFPEAERDGFYHRLPSSLEGVVRKRIWHLGKEAAGESINFTTDSKEIVVRYKVTRRISMPHMPSTGVSGVDLYTHDMHGKEVWLPGKYSFKDTVTFRFAPIDILKVREGGQLYTLFLPLYNEVEWMEIGVASDATFSFEPIPSGKPIVAYGTSICQGACASRPGMTWTNILQRRLGHTVMNFGFSGSAMHEKEVVGYIADIDAKLFILDAMPNIFSLPAETLVDSLVNSVKLIRRKRPDTPILLTDHLGYPQGQAYKNRRDAQQHALESLEKAYCILVDEGVKGLYRLRYEDLGIEADMTVEGVHVSDFGMSKYADAYEKVLREILDEPSGAYSTTQPVMQQRDSYNWMDRHNDVLKKGHGRHFRRIVIGDSIMHFWGGAEGAPAQRGTDSWEALGGESHNLGYGWDRTENVLWRIYHGELDGLTADKIFIKIGTNNISCKCSDEEILAGIEAVVNAAAARRPESEITVMGILPRRSSEDRVKTLNKKIAALAKNMKVAYADPGKELLGKKGKINESFFTDGLHPNTEGYRLIAPYFE